MRMRGTSTAIWSQEQILDSEQGTVLGAVRQVRRVLFILARLLNLSEP